MIVECPSCGTKNRLSDPLHAGHTYRCGCCKANIEPSDIAEAQDPKDGAVRASGPKVWGRACSDELDIPQEVALIEERPFSVKRLFGAALFGGLIAGYATKACDYTMPTIVSMIQGTDAVSAADLYSSSAVFPLLSFAFGAVLGSGVAALLARRYAVLAGLLATSPFALLYLTFTVLAVVTRSVHHSLLLFLLFATVVLASVAGASIGQKVSSGTWDPDLKQSKVTIFGVRWGHYFWILPLVVYPYLA